jgi:DNA-binding CsgD family transcriptional regulator
VSRAPVAVMGRAGLTRDVLVHLISTAGYEAVDASSLAVDPGRRIVVVLVEPRVHDWEAIPPGFPIVAVAPEAAEDADVLALLLEGADAVLDAEDDAAAVFAAIDALAADHALLRPRQARLALLELRRLAAERTGELRLTKREAQILASIERGEAVKQTARALGIAEKTVQNLQSRLFRKLGARNRAQAVARAHQLGVMHDSTTRARQLAVDGNGDTT